jgi:Fic family protein
MSVVKNRTWEEVEAALGSVGKLRILKFLIKNPEKAYTRYSLKKETGIKPKDVTNDLKTLVTIGCVKEYRYGRKTYQINMDNHIVQNFSVFIGKIKYL